MYGILGLRESTRGHTNLKWGWPYQRLGFTPHWRKYRRTYCMAEKFAGLWAPELVCITRAGLQLQGEQEAALWNT